MRVVRRPEELELDEPALVDEFLEGALELDVDVLCDGESSWVGGILEHVEPAGVHSGDSACVIPAPSVTAALEAEIRELSAAIAAGLGARGLLNLQLALHRGQLYVLEANPRASRTIPFLAKATGTPLVDYACRLLLGATLEELDLPSRATPTRAWAKEAVFPEERFTNAADRGPEMCSTGEVMASGDTVSEAYGRVLRSSGRGRRGGSIGPPLQRDGGRARRADRAGGAHAAAQGEPGPGASAEHLIGEALVAALGPRDDLEARCAIGTNITKRATIECSQDPRGEE
jgi:carbamoylphosphate synthase large subunit